MAYRMKFKIIIDAKFCNGCGNCLVACPVNAFSEAPVTMECEEGACHSPDSSQCNGCGVCLRVCPTRAMRIISHKLEVFQVN